MTTPFAPLLASPPDLPVARVLDEWRSSLTPGSLHVVTSPPGSGKTTLLPPLLAESCSPEASGVVVVQPRRIAARAAARRLASLLGEKPGGSVGWTVRGDRRVGPGTRIEFVTPGVLLRRLQRDPELAGVGAVLLDEFHERHLETDLVLAFLLDVRTTLREDLSVSLTSATLDADAALSFLEGATGHPAHLLAAPDEPFPLTTRWAPAPRGAEPLGPIGRDGRVGVRREFLAHVARTTATVIDDTDGDVLVFLPGRREIDEVARVLTADLAGAAEVLTLHGSLSPTAQDRVLRPGSARRVVLSTALAESSLTVPGVRAVVDAGLAREARVSPASGAGALVTVPASRAQCTQRAGRAARLGPGLVVRCFDETEWAQRRSQSLPEIATGDLTGAALHAAAWGAPGFVGLALLDVPPRGAVASARARLHALGALDGAGRVTDEGRALALAPVDPALGHALRTGARLIGARAAAEAAAILSEDVRVEGADLTDVRRALRGESARAAREHIETQRRRLLALVEDAGDGEPRHDGTADPDPAGVSAGKHGVPASDVRDSAAGNASPRRPHLASGSASHASTVAHPTQPWSSEHALALVAALAHPDWIARRRAGGTSYLLTGGSGAVLPPGSPLEGQEWLAVADLADVPGQRDLLVRAAAPLDETDALSAGAHLLRTSVDVAIESGRVRGSERRLLGAVEVGSRPLRPLPLDVTREAVLAHLGEASTSVLGWSDEAHRLRDRLRHARAILGDPWPDVSEDGLLARADEWLDTHLARLADSAALTRVDMLDALRALLPWPEAARLDELAPEALPIPAGGTRRLDWSGDVPVLALRVQQAFGWTESPRVLDGRVPVLIHLTDPAGRPVAVTSDLRSFWGGPYQQVRAQLRGRYPKHPWPEDPFSEAPTSRAKPRR